MHKQIGCTVDHIAEVAEELGRNAASSTSVSCSSRLPMLPSKCRTLKKKAENKENIEGTGDSSDNSTSSTTPGNEDADLLDIICLNRLNVSLRLL